MSDLTDFLLARIAEDEAWARAADPSWPDPDSIIVCEWGSDGSDVILVSPARALAEVEAKRQIISGLTQPAPTLHNGLRERIEQDAVEWAWSVAREGTLANLALPYADHPDYRQEWKP